MSKCIKGFFIDVQGTLIDDVNKQPINGACEFINFLNEKYIPYVVITNNTREHSDIFLKDLRQKGLNIKSYIDPFCILKDVVKSKKVAAFGTSNFLKILENLNYELNYEEFESLIVSSSKDYTNEDYAQMIECAFKTNNLVAMHGTSTYSKDGKRYPGVGAIMSMLKFAVNKDYKVVGKPSFGFFEKARGLIDLEFNDITVISDDMIGDLLGAANLHMNSCLVLSGKVRSKKELLDTLQNNEIPKNICKDMSEVLELLKKGEI